MKAFFSRITRWHKRFISIDGNLSRVVIVSVCALVIILLLSTKIINIYVGNKMIDKVMDTNNRYISSIGRNIDDQIRYMHNIVYKYINEESVRRIANHRTGGYDEYRAIQDIKKNIRWNTIENELLFDIVITFRDQDYVITKNGQFSDDFFFANNYFNDEYC